MIILCDSIYKKEIFPQKEMFTLDVIEKAVQRAEKGLGNSLRKAKTAHTKLLKVYITTAHGAGRIIFLLKTQNHAYIPVILRHKNDKKIGQNMSMKNKDFVDILDTNLDLIASDIERGNFQKIS